MDHIKTVKSIFRNGLNTIRRVVFKNPRSKKSLSVLYHNALALIDSSNNCDDELFDYKKIIKGKRNYKTREIYYGNSYYGHASVLKDYSGYNEKINACIEHGVYFGDTVFEEEAINSGMNGLITFGDKRLEHLMPVAKVPVIPIGPYIHYAEPLLSQDEIAEFKQKKGKTLLVFPTHSIDRVETEFDFESFNNKIQEVVRNLNINHVMICLFYKDINIGRDKFYIDKGYQVVCNGYRCDPVFLRRLKTFILLSDITMSNDVGTNIGYCIFLGKPHYIYHQKISFNAYTDNDMENVMQGNIIEQEMQEVRDAFSEITDAISPLQKDICNKYWGIQYVRERGELLSILQEFQK